jgi:hypothetical protein
MTDDIQVVKCKFDAVLKRMIATKPTPHKEIVRRSKANRSKKKKIQKMDK